MKIEELKGVVRRAKLDFVNGRAGIHTEGPEKYVTEQIHEYQQKVDTTEKEIDNLLGEVICEVGEEEAKYAVSAVSTICEILRGFLHKIGNQCQNENGVWKIDFTPSKEDTAKFQYTVASLERNYPTPKL